MVGYRARTVLMCVSLALGWHTLQEDRALQLALRARCLALVRACEEHLADLQTWKAADVAKCGL